MSDADILVIGAGAAGLMAARTLAKAGKKIAVLEARERCGGRIHTLKRSKLLEAVELGAEFVHGDLPFTLNLLNEAGVGYYAGTAEMWQYKNGRFDNEGGFMPDWVLLMDRLGKLQQDISIEDFLQQEFPGDKYHNLKNSVRRFVHGYDTAETAKVSALALQKEWQCEDDDLQYRIKGGYGAIINHLEKEFKKEGGFIHLNSVVKDIHWQPGKVKAITEEGKVYEAEKILIALPLGVLKAMEQEKGAVTFHPKTPEHADAINLMGFGAIIKILLEFDELFWEDKITEALAGKSLKNMGFLISGEEIPTWWTQVPTRSPILTGWLGGPEAMRKKDLPGEEILSQSLRSLSNIFKRSQEELMDKLKSYYITNWTSEPFTRGSYAFDIVGAQASRKILNTPLNDTIFFAGEYLYDGYAMGTVEAAFASGEEVAKRIINFNF